MQKLKIQIGPIAEKDRKMLITQVHAYLTLKCENVKKVHVVQAAKTLVCMVPNLKDTTQGEMAGYVRISFELILFVIST